MASILDFVENGDPTELFNLEKEFAVGSFGTVYKVNTFASTSYVFDVGYKKH